MFLDSVEKPRTARVNMEVTVSFFFIKLKKSAMKIFKIFTGAFSQMIEKQTNFAPEQRNRPRRFVSEPVFS